MTSARCLAAAALLLAACGPRPEAPVQQPPVGAAHAARSAPEPHAFPHERLTRGTIELRDGDMISLVGGALAERMQHHGWLEARLAERFPSLGLSFRNLGFSADELTVAQRTAGFGSRDEWLERTGADVVFAFFGFNESFAGDEGLGAFRADLSDFIRHVRGLRSPDGAPLRLVLFSPTPYETLRDSLLPDAAAGNDRLHPYVEAMADAADAADVPFVDLFHPMLARFDEARREARGRPRAWAGIGDPDALSMNGVHLTERGNEVLAEVIEAEMFARNNGARPDAERLEALRQAVLEKNHLWFNRYRATDGYNVYGGRSSLAYTDGVTNRDVLQREMEVLDAMAAQGDRRIAGIARGEHIMSLDGTPALIPVVTNRPGDAPGGGHFFVGDSMGTNFMTPAEGMEVSLFAGEKRFPELANPVQMSWDARGRLWVAVWPTYPHWKPDQPMNDKLVILEDTDGDGEADELTVFADGLHNPTGFEFWNGGVFVANAPDLLFLKDTDGDDVADVKERVLHGLSSADTHHSANSFVMGPDGALYFQEGIFHQSQVETAHGPVRNRDGCVWRFEPRTWRVERYVPYGFLNPHGHVFDRWGQDFVTDGTGNDNYYALPFSGHVEQGRKHGGYFRFFDQRSRPSAATEILSSAHFPDAMQGEYLIANVIGFQGIFAYRLEDAGSGFGAVEVDPVVHSAESNFRPVDIEMGPDGAIYFLDWQNPLIGHMQHHLRDPSRDHSHGRVYRVTYPARDLSEPAVIADRPMHELLDLLKHPEDRVRYRARIELSRHDGRLVLNAVNQWQKKLDQSDPEYEHHKLEALWTLQQHGVVHERLLVTVLESPDPRARAAAVRVVRQMRRQVAQPLTRLQTAISDESPRVRLEALVALSFMESAAAAEIALSVLDAPMDRFLDYALRETMATLKPYWRAALAGGEPFAQRNHAGLAWAIARLDTEELAGVQRSEARALEMLSRHGLSDVQYASALADLTDLRGSSFAGELIAAIHRADDRPNDHADHLLSGLFSTLDVLPRPELELLSPALRELSTDGRRAATRKLATVARVRSDGSVEPAWNEALTSLGALGDLLDAAALLDDENLARSMFFQVLPVLDEVPRDLMVQATAAQGTQGRYVRIELPGAKRTLTLAEVAVFSGGFNIALDAAASQSTTNWGGVAERAMDGNTSGVYGDGGQTHTVEDRPNPWWELDLGAERPIDAVMIWNRTEGDGRWVSRLDGYTLRVLDGQRRTVFEVHDQRAPQVSAVLEMGDPVLRVRRAAARCLAALGVHQDVAVRTLVERLDDDDLRPAVVEALAGIPMERWSDDDLHMAMQVTTGLFMKLLPGDFESEAGRDVLALADRMIAHLDEETGRVLRVARRPLGPQVIVIRPVRDSLMYDRTEFTVLAGQGVELVFDNTDIMPHNLIVTVPGALAKVGLAGEAMSKDPDAWDRGYVPDLPEVLWSTRLLQPGESQTIRFVAPDDQGDHPYVCTFPGHWIRMNGVMHVVLDVEAALAAESAEAAAPPRVGGVDAVPPEKRSFVRNWTPDDFIAGLGGVDEASAANGREVFEAGSCLKCHYVGGEGGRTGPPLSEVIPRYGREELLTQILDPSAVLLEDYESEVFVIKGGQVHSGRVMAENSREVSVRTNPYLDDVVTTFEKSRIADRWTSQLSAMPEGLLSTFTRAEILDLVAYLESLRETD